MKWLLKENKKYKAEWILFNISLIIFDLCSIIPPMLLGYLIDDGLKTNNQQYTLYLGIFIILFSIIQQIGSYASVIKLDYTCHKMASNIKQKCYQKLNELDLNFYQNNSTGELITLMVSDIDEIKRHLSFTTKTIAYLSLRFLGSFIFLLYTNYQLTLLLMIPIPIIALITIKYKKRTKPLYKNIRDNLAVLNNHIQDNIEGNKVVKAFACEENEIKEMKNKNKEYTNIKIKTNNISKYYLSFINFFTNSITIIFIIAGGYFLINGSLSLGNLIAFQSLLGYLTNPFLNIGNIIDRILNFTISKERIMHLLEAKSLIENDKKLKVDSLLVPITFKDITVNYDNTNVIKNINLTINPGKTVAFIGPTGSGKSTIASLLLRFIDPKEGNIFIGNRNIKDFDIKSIRSKIGYVAQQPFLFSDTIKNNIGYGNSNLSEKEMLNVANIAKLTYVDKLENGFDTIIGEKGVGLSGGEKQRLSLARALAVKPEILILDDVTSALDIETEQSITENLKQIHSVKTKIIIAQKTISVKDADKIYVISNHKILEQGTHEELLKNKKYYYEIYKIQNSLKEGDE